MKGKIYTDQKAYMAAIKSNCCPKFVDGSKVYKEIICKNLPQNDGIAYLYPPWSCLYNKNKDGIGNCLDDYIIYAIKVENSNVTEYWYIFKCGTCKKPESKLFDGCHNCVPNEKKTVQTIYNEYSKNTCSEVAKPQNPGEYFEQWIQNHWKEIQESVNNKTQTLFPEKITSCGIQNPKRIDLSSTTQPPKFTLIAPGAASGSFGTCDFTDATEENGVNFFLEAKVAFGSLILTEAESRLLKAVVDFNSQKPPPASKKSFWIIIAKNYKIEKNKFKPTELLIVGPEMLSSLLPPPQRVPAPNPPKLTCIAPPKKCGVTTIKLVQ